MLNPLLAKVTKYFLIAKRCLRMCRDSGKKRPFGSSHPKYDTLPIIPLTLRPSVFDYSLVAGHPSFRKISHKTAQYHWDTKYADLCRWTKACLTYQMRDNCRLIKLIFLRSSSPINIEGVLNLYIEGVLNLYWIGRVFLYCYSFRAHPTITHCLP